MQLGMVGPARMGPSLVRRLLPVGHECVVFDVDSTPVNELEAESATGAGSLDELVEKLDKPLPRPRPVRRPNALGKAQPVRRSCREA